MVLSQLPVPSRRLLVHSASGCEWSPPLRRCKYVLYVYSMYVYMGMQAEVDKA